jgi:hypothetical protein
MAENNFNKLHEQAIAEYESFMREVDYLQELYEEEQQNLANAEEWNRLEMESCCPLCGV